MNQAPQGGPSRSPRREGAGPPTTLGGKGGLVYGSRRDGGSLTGLGDGPPTGGGWGGFKMGWARVRGLSVGGGGWAAATHYSCSGHCKSPCTGLKKVAVLAPEGSGLAEAIRDRLTKAATR